jgi:hypothetical protein
MLPSFFPVSLKNEQTKATYDTAASNQLTKKSHGKLPMDQV